MHSSLIRIISKSHKIHFGATMQPLFPSLDGHISQGRVSKLLFLFLLRCISSLDRRAYCIIKSILVIQDYILGWPLHPGETLPMRTSTKKYQGQEVLSLWDTLHCSTRKRNRWQHCKNSTLRATSYVHSYKSQISLVHKWRVSEEKWPITNLLHALILAKAVPRKDHFTCLRSPAKSTFKSLILETPLWRGVMSTNLKRDAEQSALTNACHTHCASRQLGTTVVWRYDLFRDQLWDACQLARVHWGIHREGFCSKEGLHYCIRWRARNPLEQDQVQRVLEILSRSCHWMINNQPLFTSLVIPWGFLAWAVLHGCSGGLCHARKYKLKAYV